MTSTTIYTATEFARCRDDSPLPYYSAYSTLEDAKAACQEAANVEWRELFEREGFCPLEWRDVEGGRWEATWDVEDDEDEHLYIVVIAMLQP